ncbi:MAG: hypothetical protein VX009_00210 [Pseudomonadota bacterium]|nr:hypothetical protein [Pseudomonadota bacterium]
MVFKKKPKIGIVVGLKSEKNSITPKENIIIECGYGEHAYEAANKVLKNKIDFIVSFGLAGSMTKRLKSSQIIIPNKVIGKQIKSKKTSFALNSYLREKSKNKIVSNIKLLTSNKILNKKTNSLDFDAVDMEAGFVFKAALKHKIPFTSVKVIFDDLENSIPNFLISSIDKKGELKFFDLFTHIVKKPSRIKKLLKLNKIYKSSMRKLKLVAHQLF